jgi:hypothetical protein
MKEGAMRLFRDVVISVCIGAAWAVLVGEAVGYLAATNPGRPAEMDALAQGDWASFLALALLRDAATYLLPALFAGYLIVRLMAKPLVFALVAASIPFLMHAFEVARAMQGGGFGGARGVYFALNTLLVLAAIPACTAVVLFLTKRFAGAAPQAS